VDIQIVFEQQVIEMTLNESQASKDLASQLPMKIKVEDYASNEKIFYPPKKLSTAGSPSGYEPKVGDVTYYSPWGDVAIFYKNFSYSNGLIPLGRITSGFEYLKSINNKEVEIRESKK